MNFFLYGPMSNKWFTWAIGGLLLVLLWFIIWSPPAPPVKQVKLRVLDQDGVKGKLYDLKVGPWQNRVDQDLEATRSQIKNMDSNQKEIKQELKLIADTLAILAREKEEKEEARKPPGPSFPDQRALGGGINALRFGESRTPGHPSEVKPVPQSSIGPTTYLSGLS